MKQIGKVDILAFGAHPDDVELSCSGTLLHHIDMGYSIGIVDLTLGELGTRGDAALRTQEAFLAAQKMGASFRYQMRLADAFFGQSKDELLALIQVIRQAQPKIVLANALSDRHPDHGRAAKLVADACFYSGLFKINTADTHGVPLPPWRPDLVLHYIQDHHLKADLVFDISSYMDKKIEIISCFSSQFYNPNSHEPESPISGKSFFDYIRAKAKVFARPIFAEYAEGFQLARPAGVKNLFDLQ